ncbi:hypothetical protein D4764_04G0012070 [Takifugu flavidus]|uniref:Uncharacterized protein n=1 Tax=Takifugu flavidus TaxID=433684 RepID=A0A5C6N9M9_9TELE|nr:hypothetical protein D4764_04G0012070 [Takifugu flavidus]
MGCCCSKTDEWRDSDSDSESISDINSDISSLSDILHYSGWRTVMVEHRQHTTAGTQHAWLDADLKGDSRCKEEPEVLRNPTRGVGHTLDSDPCCGAAQTEDRRRGKHFSWVKAVQTGPVNSC